MGIGEKIKGFFKRDKSGKDKKPAAEAKPAYDFSGDSLAKELTYAAEKIDAAVEAKKMNPARAEQFMAQLNGVKESDAPDDKRRIDISRIIGGIIYG